MNTIVRKGSIGLTGVCLTLWLSAGANATTLSQVSVNSASVPGATATATDNTGHDTELGYDSAGAVGRAYSSTISSPYGNYVAKPTTDSVYAKASLQDGELKAKASLSFGSDLWGTGSAGTSNANASATATVADTFHIYDSNTNTPFVWSSGDNATFQFSITGLSNIDSAILPSPVNPYDYPPQPGVLKNTLYTRLGLNLYKVGTMALIAQINNLDWSDYNAALAQYNALNAQITANTIATDFWFLGDPVMYGADTIDPAKILAVSPDTPTDIYYDFNPDGDFEWQLLLDVTAQIDASLQNVGAVLDFSHTVTTNYVGPVGSTTYSESGLFPTTLSLDDLPGNTPAVPEPASAALMGLGCLAMVMGMSRRRNKLAA